MNRESGGGGGVRWNTFRFYLLKESVQILVAFRVNCRLKKRQKEILQHLLKTAEAVFPTPIHVAGMRKKIDVTVSVSFSENILLRTRVAALE